MIEVIFGFCLGLGYAAAFPNSLLKIRAKILSYFKEGCEHDKQEDKPPQYNNNRSKSRYD